MNTLVIAILSTLASFAVAIGSFGLVLYMCKPKTGLEATAKFLLFIAGIAATLSLNIWWPMMWITWLIWIALIFGCLIFYQFIRSNLDPKMEIASYSAWPRILLFLAIVALVLDALSAGLPVYRYDQWAYSLVISKWISHLGTLASPMTDDHIFFTGTYEYLGLLARTLSEDDAFQQGFQNSLSYWLVVLPAITLGMDVQKPSIWKFPIAFAFAVLVVFGTGDHQALVNAKPDFVNMMIASCILLSMQKKNSIEKLSPTILGMLYITGFSFKLTWMHFTIASAPIVALSLIWPQEGGHREPRMNLAPILKVFRGALLATPLLSPLLIKNYMKFNNPLHPAQTFLWQSSMWNDRLAKYWRTVMNKPETLGAFFDNLGETIRLLPSRFQSTLPAMCLLLSILVIDRMKGKYEVRDASRILLTILIAVIYIGTWGLFYTAQTADRFVSPLHAMMLVIILGILGLSRPRAATAAAMLIPALAVSQMEVNLLQLSVASSRDVPNFHDYFERSPSASNKHLRFIAQHRNSNHPGAKFNQAVLMSDFFHSYYGSSQNYPANSAMAWWTLSSNGIDPDSGCAVDLFVARDIRYVMALTDPSLTSWPSAVVKMLPSMTEIPMDGGRLWYVKSFDLLSCKIQ